eukprot:2333097-Rhodomonas_salina.1
MLLRACYASSGTELAYAATSPSDYAVLGQPYAICLRVCYAMSSTLISAYAHAMGCPVLTCSAICLRVCDATPGTDIAYDVLHAMRCP